MLWTRNSAIGENLLYLYSQVISQALQIWSLELVPFLRQCPEAERARENPASQNAFICHYRHHWFTIRKIGKQWFNLNSILSAPKLISETYLAIYLAQLKEEGNSIFIITGTLPRCEADEILSVRPFSLKFHLFLFCHLTFHVCYAVKLFLSLFHSTFLFWSSVSALSYFLFCQFWYMQILKP